METPSVSIIIVNYNGEKTLGDCLSSIKCLNYPRDKIETILVDNASADQSLAMVKKAFPEVRVISTGENLGFGGANNIGARYARGEVIAFLNPDARVDPDWLKIQISKMDPHRGVVCTAAKILSWDGKMVDFAGGALEWSGHGFQLGLGSREDLDKYKKEQPTLFGCGAAFAIDRRIFLEAGGFDEDYFLQYEDVDFGWRLWLLGYKVLFVPEAIAFHDPHQSTHLLRPEEKLFLEERNALWSIIKNYEDATLQFLLPFSLFSLPQTMMKHSDRHADLIAQVETDTLPKINFFLRRHSPLEKLGFYLKKEGPGGAFTRLVDGLRRRRFFNRGGGGEVTLLHQVLQAVIVTWDMTFEKRKRLQAIRKRSDQEIFDLVGIPNVLGIPLLEETPLKIDRQLPELIDQVLELNPLKIDRQLPELIDQVLELNPLKIDEGRRKLIHRILTLNPLQIDQGRHELIQQIFDLEFLKIDPGRRELIRLVLEFGPLKIEKGTQRLINQILELDSSKIEGELLGLINQIVVKTQEKGRLLSTARGAPMDKVLSLVGNNRKDAGVP